MHVPEDGDADRVDGEHEHGKAEEGAATELEDGCAKLLVTIPLIGSCRVSLTMKATGPEKVVGDDEMEGFGNKESDTPHEQEEETCHACQCAIWLDEGRQDSR